MSEKPKSMKLITLAMYSLMMKNDYCSISVKDICEKAGVSRMSFYRYFSSKEDIFLSFCDERFAEFYDEIMEIELVTPDIFINLIVTYFKKFSREIKMLQKANKLQLLLNQFESYASYLLNHLNTERYRTLKGNPVAVPFLAGGIFNTLVKWNNQNFKESEEYITKKILEVLQLELN